MCYLVTMSFNESTWYNDWVQACKCFQACITVYKHIQVSVHRGQVLKLLQA